MTLGCFAQALAMTQQNVIASKESQETFRLTQHDKSHQPNFSLISAGGGGMILLLLTHQTKGAQ